MRILILLSLLLQYSQSFGQLTFLDVLSLENKSYKEIQAYMLENYTMIDDSKEYFYFPLKKCNPPQYFEDSCEWSCSQPEFLDGIKSKYPLNEVVFKESSNKNYEVWLTLKSTFGENYDPQTKRAITFIDIREKTTWANNNCQNELRYNGAKANEAVNITIQFSDYEEWVSFKRNVAQNAAFQNTWRSKDDAPIELRYGIRRIMKNGYWKGVFINLYENGTTYHASISFDSYGVD